jgi:acyl-coenzyme A thioesterase PaaI-like protein
MQNKTLQILKRVQGLPAGLWLFSRLVAFKAPYFSSIRPVFLALEPGFARATISNRRKVRNHLGTVHAIAMANLCEFVGGTLMEVSISPDMRWIPKGMTIRYLGLAKSDVTAECRIDDCNWTEAQDVVLQVAVRDEAGVVVSEAEIPMYVSPRPKKGS